MSATIAVVTKDRPKLTKVTQIELPFGGTIRSGILKRATNSSKKVLLENRTTD